MFKRITVASIVIIAFISLSYSIHSFANEESTTIDYSGGLIDSIVGHKAISSQTVKTDEVAKVTDNDESTYDVLASYDSGATRLDHFVFELTEPAKIGFIRLKTDSPDSTINVYFFNSSNQLIKTYTATTKDGSLEQLPEDISTADVTKVAIHNKSNTDNKVFEFNVYPANFTEEPATEEPTTEEPAPETKNVLLRIQMVDGFEKEYTLSTEEADDFENWLGSRLNGEGKAIYTFNNEELKRTENLVYDQIVYYEITNL